MKILIINLPRYQGMSVTREGRCEFICNYRVDTPATLLILASLLKESNNQIDFIDANAMNLDYKYLKMLIKQKNPSSIIFTFNSWIIEQELKICKIVKEINPNCITIGYSWFAERFGSEILNKYQYLDIQIVDDPFSIINKLIQLINEKRNLAEIEGIVYRNKDNKVIINKKIKNKRRFKDLPLPAYELLPSFKPYYLYSPLLKPYVLVYAGKGCPFSCAYCPDANTMYSGRSAKDIIDELEILKKLGKIKFVWFYDEIFTINKRRVIEVCNGIIKKNLKIRWFCDSRVDLVDKKMLKLMKAAGCIGISYGVESGSNKILRAMKKSISVSQAKNALKWTREARIPIQLNLILGYIGENKRTLSETENFIKLTLPEIMQISVIIAMHGTEFSNIAITNKWICEDLSWHDKITDLRIDKTRYEPYNLNFQKVIKKLYKTLYLNPKWWINSIKTIIKNYGLIFPLLGILLYKYKSIKLF